MSSTGTPTFLFQTMDAKPKSPKSPKVILENPLLKGPQFLLGAHQAPSLVTEAQQPKSQLRDFPSNGFAGKAAQVASPGPPPKASLSLMGMMPVTTTNNPSSPLGKRDPRTPPPVASPMLLHHDTTATTVASTSIPAAVDGNWVIAFGYTNREEYQELVGILSTYGSILQQQTNANWLAIQYDCRLSAEKALCSQPIRLSSSPSLCGTVRGSSHLLQQLLSEPPTSSNVGSRQRDFFFSNSSVSEVGPKGKFASSRQSSLEEEDILANFDDDDNRFHTPNTVCEKLLSWYFGWNQELAAHPHSD